MRLPRFAVFACWLAGARSLLGAAHPWANVLLIVADGLGSAGLGCFGSEIATPNLDRLASEGIKFKQFYTYPRCCPARAAMLTGVYPPQAGVGHMVERSGLPLPDHGFPGYKGELNTRVVTIAEALRESGY